MKNIKNYSKGFLSLIAITLVSNSSFAASTDTAGFSNTTMFSILVALAVLVLIGILYVSSSIKELMQSDLFKDKIYEAEKKKREGKDNSKVIMTLLVLFGLPFASFSQGGTPAEATDMSMDWVWAMVLINVILVGFAFYLKKIFTNVLEVIKPKVIKTKVNKFGKTVATKETNTLTQLLTDTVSLEDEESILMDHEYDGIHELDNNLPPWWIWSFYASIVFAVIYLFHYQVFGTGDLQIAEYEKDMKQTELAIKEYKKGLKGNVTEENVLMLTETSDLSSGKKIFKDNCILCHGALGEGTIGPNLTDDYWIKGGSIKDVFTTVKYGTKNGMKSWKKDLSAVEMQQVSSFIKSIKGTVENGKEAEGKLYKEGDVSTEEVSESTEETTPEATTSEVREIKTLKDKKSLTAGKAVFDLNCVACHGSKLEGNPVGPNLTDNAWIYGGNTGEIVHTIENGATKGMQAWKGNLSEEQIIQVASYIQSLQGSNPPNAKAPEGEVSK